jgi:hypothetical protein
MFRPGETICVSPDKYGYHSVPLEMALSEKVTLVSPQSGIVPTVKSTDELKLVALNPIKGFRRDQNVVKFRNFMLELDTGTPLEQYNTIKKLQIPLTAITFSGNKSLHICISLDIDTLPNEKSYRIISKWLLNIVTLADQNIQNPSRGYRIPGALREPGKTQKLLELNRAIKLEELTDWLKKYPDCKPKPRTPQPVSGNNNWDRLSNWVKYKLKNGLDPLGSRNQQWFSIACNFREAGYSIDEAIHCILPYFKPEHDFTEREFLSCIKSGFRYNRG